MDSKTKNIIYALIAIVVVVLLGSMVYKGMNRNDVDGDNNTSSTTTSVNAGHVNQPAPKGNSASGKTATNTQTGLNLENNAVLVTVISNAQIRVPQTGTDVTLTAGEANYLDTSGKVAGHVLAGKILGWSKTEKGYDVYTDMTVTRTGQPQILHYVALFYVTSSTDVKFTSAVLIGDRVPVTGAVASVDPSKQVNPSVTIMNSALGYLVTINYLDRKNGEPLTATPSLSKSVTLTVKNHILSK